MAPMKKFKQMGKDSEKMAMAVGFSLLLLALLQYSSTKSRQFNMQGYKSNSQLHSHPTQVNNNQTILGDTLPSQALGNNGSFASNEIPKAKSGTPVDLLPNDTNSQWASLNPTGNGSLEKVNLLPAGTLTGINTVSNTLKNANLQIRAEPPNPKMNVGPWQNSTIERDSKYQFGLKVDC
tara:strand:- start:68 stop:604 length:537 start_codon:yes stop_codon:yes gene_type:complete